jgi:hypothetical protein
LISTEDVVRRPTAINKRSSQTEHRGSIGVPEITEEVWIEVGQAVPVEQLA